jgi:RNA polymerase sigma factor (sigma-70 family)
VTDAELLARYVRLRDAAAFELLFWRHGPMVWGVCRRVLSNRHDAEDAFQVTFLVLARKAGSIRKRGSVSSWLHGAAFRAALEVRAARRRAKEEQVSAIPEPAVEPDEDGWAELRPLLDRELNALADIYRSAVVLCDLEGKSRQEAARDLGIPEGTLSSRLATARRILAERLGRRGLTLSVAALIATLSQGAASAGVPPALLKTTAAVAAGGATSAALAALTDGVLRTMLLMKLKGTMVVLVACFAVLGSGAMTYRALAAPRAVPAVARPNRVLPTQAGFLRITDSDQIDAVAFSPDGSELSTGSQDGQIRIWDVATGKEKRTIKGPNHPVRRLLYTPDGKRVISGADDGVLRLWDVATGKELRSQKADLPSEPGSQVDVNAIEHLPGGGLVAAYNYEVKGKGEWHTRLVLWDKDGTKPETLVQQGGHIYSVAVSADGKRLAVPMLGEFGGLKVWDLETRKEVWSQPASDMMSAVAFSRDGKRLAVGGGYSFEVKGAGFKTEARLWVYDVATKRLVWQAKEPENGAYSRLVFTPDGKGVITGSSGRIVDYMPPGGGSGSKVVSELRRRDATTGKDVWRTEGDLGYFSAVALTRDGKHLAAGDHTQLSLYDPQTGKLLKVIVKRTK